MAEIALPGIRSQWGTTIAAQGGRVIVSFEDEQRANIRRYEVSSGRFLSTFPGANETTPGRRFSALWPRSIINAQGVHAVCYQRGDWPALASDQSAGYLDQVVPCFGLHTVGISATSSIYNVTGTRPDDADHGRVTFGTEGILGWDGTRWLPWSAGDETATPPIHPWLRTTCVLPGGWACGFDESPQHTGQKVLLKNPAGALFLIFDGLEMRDPQIAQDTDGAIWACATDQAGVLHVASGPFPAFDPQPVVVAPYTRPLWTGYFKDDSTSHGQCQVLDREAQIPDVRGPYLPRQDLLAAAARTWDRVVAVYVEVETPDKGVVERALTQARHDMHTLGLPRRPCLTYTGSTNLGGTTAEDVGLQVYFDTLPTAAEYTAYLRTQLTHVTGHGRPWLIAQAYDRRRTTAPDPYWTEDRLATLQALHAEALRVFPALRGGLFFAFNRLGGARDYPRVLQWDQAIFAAVPSTPPIETIPDPEPTPMPGTHFNPSVTPHDVIARSFEIVRQWAQGYQWPADSGIFPYAADFQGGLIAEGIMYYFETVGAGELFKLPTGGSAEYWADRERRGADAVIHALRVRAGDTGSGGPQ